MSTADALKALQTSGSLTPWIPMLTRRTPKRRLYLTPEALNDLRNPDSALNLKASSRGQTRGRIEANLDHWVLGGHVYLSRQRRFICRLSPPPPEIWELRVTEPTPQVRLFGRFLEPDTLVITKMRMRDELGDAGSRAWETAMRDCAKRWAALFPTTPAHSARTVHEYITEKCDDYGPDCKPPKRPRSRRVRSRKN
jgi:hypothetical protein